MGGRLRGVHPDFLLEQRSDLRRFDPPSARAAQAILGLLRTVFGVSRGSLPNQQADRISPTWASK